MSRKIDVRIMKLKKWHIPKSMELSELTNPVILGCFDELKVDGLSVDLEQEKIHPFMAGHRKQIDIKNSEKQEPADFNSQEQILFLNISESEAVDGTSFTEKAVQTFWQYPDCTFPFLYLTMIHISPNNKLCQILKKIHEVFGKDYLSYTSYDYCDIVLFAQNLSISSYLNKVRKLFVLKPEEEKNIFDTFSMVCFHPKYASGKWEPFIDKKDKFQATININVRNHKQFKEWYQNNIREQPDTRYNIYGRHDISIIKENADAKWLMKIMQKLHDKENQELFWTFETFIKVRNLHDLDLESDTSEYLNPVYNLVKENLQQEINKLKAAIDHSILKGQASYILPIYEVRDCICSIVKNSFAEEFICCIYESFLHFVSYMTAEIEILDIKSEEYQKRKEERGLNRLPEWEDQIAESYDKYFMALNTLVNSTMHNERQFVQATAFNAVFYSVPPKIMAFYNAYIYRIKQILIDKECQNRYTFLIYPSFSSTIMLEQISLDEEPPCDRILTVRFNEDSLYDIESVIYQLVHELAHQVGNDLRCRKERAQQIDTILLKWITRNCNIDYDTYQILLPKITGSDQKNKNPDSQKDEQEKEYLQHIFQRGKHILYNLNYQQDLLSASPEYFFERLNADSTYRDPLLKKCGIREEDQLSYVQNYREQYCKLKYYDFKNKLEKMNDINRERKYERYVDIISSAYHECYADLQMILILAMSAEDYLNTFLTDQLLSIRKLLSQPRDQIRICTIFRVMTDCGLWQQPASQDNEGYQLVYKIISEYNGKVAAKTEPQRIQESKLKANECMEHAKTFDFGNGIRLKKSLSDKLIRAIREAAEKESMSNPLIELAAGLYEYLLIVMNESLKEYSTEEKLSKIRQVRNLIHKILAFEDATVIFNCVENELDFYKREGCKIYPHLMNRSHPKAIINEP